MNVRVIDANTLGLLLSLMQRVKDGDVAANVIKRGSLETIISFDVINDEVEKDKVACKGCKWIKENEDYGRYSECHSPHSEYTSGFDPVEGEVKDFGWCKRLNEKLDCKFYVEKPVEAVLKKKKRFFGGW